MTKTQHTPGPWRVMCDDDLSLYVCAKWIQDDEDILASIESGNLNDARLIAAAPELLEALEASYKMLLGVTMDEASTENMLRFRAAIAKAKGEAK